jgi:hypothetical protein
MALFGGKQKPDTNTSISYEPVPLFTTRTTVGGGSPLAISSVNTWDGQSHGLGSAASFIGIDPNYAPSRDEIYSIPDVFAEVRAINNALSDNGSQLHSIAVADWRAVMTIILLYQELNLTIEETVIDFTALSEYDAMFLHAAAEYLPKSYNGKITVYQTKTDMGQSVPFAFSSPEYFLCPAKEIRSRLLINSEIAEYDETSSRTVFKDPARFLHSNPGFGYRVIEVLTEAVQQRRVRNASSLMSDFIRSIGIQSYTEARLAAGLLRFSDWAEFVCNIPSNGLSAEKIFADEICLFLTADEYADKKEGITLTYEDVFQDAMADHRVKEGNGKVAHYALLPFRKEFLQEYAYLEDGQPDATVFRGLEMLKRQDGNSKYIEVSLLYKSVKYSTRYDETKWVRPSPGKYSVPPISVWPNSRDEAQIWNAYYAFIGLRYDENENAHNWSALSFDALVRNGKNIEQTKGLHFMEPHNVAARQYIDCEYEIIETETYPHILLCNLSDGSKYLGALAMSSGGPGVHIVADRVAIIGIDFGTSNTVAFYSLKNGDTLEQPKPIDFKNANVQPTIANYVFDKMSSRFFLSRNELTGDVSFPTILHVSDKKNNKPALFNGANIYFRGNEAKNGSDVEIMKVPNLETDIKWSSDAAKKTYTLKFVTELAVFCAWQAVSKTQAGKLEWRFSFPSSISNSGDFTSALRSAAESAASFVFGNRASDKPKIDLTSESHAAGLYFMNQPIPRVNRDKGFISIDIGGGSTDISIWQNDITHAKAEASVKFAGKDILTNNAISLCENEQMPRLWSEMGVEEKVIDNVINSLNDADLEPQILFETMLSIAGKNLKDALRIHNEEKPLSNIIKLITFNLSMLVGLAGSMLRELVVNDVFELKDELMIVFCGNGSKTRNWLQAENNKIMENVIREMVGKQLKDVRIVFEQSENPKQEVAAGLVSVVRLRNENEEFNPSNYKDDMLDQKVIINGSGEKFPSVVEEVVYLFDRLYDILANDDMSFKISKYQSFRDKDAFLEKMKSAIAALDPNGTGYSKITFAYAFVKCAQVANNMLITDMKNQ